MTNIVDLLDRYIAQEFRGAPKKERDLDLLLAARHEAQAMLDKAERRTALFGFFVSSANWAERHLTWRGFQWRCRYCKAPYTHTITHTDECVITCAHNEPEQFLRKPKIVGEPCLDKNGQPVPLKRGKDADRFEQGGKRKRTDDHIPEFQPGDVVRVKGLQWQHQSGSAVVGTVINRLGFATYSVDINGNAMVCAANTLELQQSQDTDDDRPPKEEGDYTWLV